VRLRVEALEHRLTPSNFLVTTAADNGNNANPTPGSLRDAITQAVNNPDPFHDIRFAANVTGTISLSSALPGLDADINIIGPGAKVLTVARSSAAGTPNFSVFTVHSGVSVTIRGLTISGGNATSGGGINNQGTLLLQDSAVTNNTATEQGGGIFSSHGVGTANPSLTVDHSLISNNHITIAPDGGAAGIEIAVGNLNLQSSTVTGNSPTGVGMDAGTATILNSTIAFNDATGSINAAGLNETPGAVPTVLVSDTIIAQNTTTANGAVPSDVSGSLTDTPAVGGGASGHNLLGDGDGTGLTNGTNGDEVGTAVNPIDPQLGPLADNGGATMTLALQATSPARDAGANPGSNAQLPADQRGFTRIVANTIDIGAFEFGATLVANVIVVSGPAEPTTNQAVTYTATITPDVTGAAAASATGVMHFTLDGQPEPDGQLTNNQATLSLPNGVMSAGSHTITATYPGDATFLGGTTSFTFPSVSGTTGPGSTGPTVTGNVTSQLSVSLGRPPAVKKHKPKPGSAVLTVTNNGSQIILGPLHIELIGLLKKLKVKGASFIGTGKRKIPVLTLNPPGGALQPHATATLMVQFNGKPNKTITFKVFAATPPT
jgi:predicted outer membrane repeat protein